jgi:pyruvate formate-lyase activating enzyme-like uncharacterized protein
MPSNTIRKISEMHLNWFKSNSRNSHGVTTHSCRAAQKDSAQLNIKRRRKSECSRRHYFLADQ